MSRYCTKCGAALADGSMFCGKCGAKVNDSENFSASNNTQTNATTPVRKPAAIKWSSLFLIVLVVIWGVRYFGPKVDTSWAVDKACAEVKSEVYNDYGEVPRVSGELIYKDGENYIIVVKYEVPGWKWEASCACLVYGYRESNCFVSRMTTEMSYDYNYKANLDELKALWALD